MKTLFFLLASFTATAQVFTLSDGSKLSLVDDKGAILVTVDAPKEIQVAPGKSYIFLLLEIPGNTSGKTIVVSEKGTTPAPGLVLKETIDNTDPRNVYSGTWVTAHKVAGTNTATQIFNAPWTDNFLNDNVTFSTVVGSSFTFQFTGKKIEWWAEKRENHQNVSVEVDGQVEAVNLNASTKANDVQKVYEKTLPQGSHTVKITNTGTSVVHDHFKVYE